MAMVPADSGVEQTPAAMPRLDPDSAGWLRMLAGTGPEREAALARLHEMLVRIARGEVGRRAPRLQLTGAATVPAHRRRGVQTALLSARLADAAAAGCDVAVITTQPGSKSQQNAQRQGFDLLYTRAVLVKPS